MYNFLIFCFTFAVILSSFTDAFPSGKDTIQHGIMAIQNGGSTFGVSSMAGVAANDGKVSSLGGVKVFSPPGMTVSKDGDTMRFEYPLENGMASGFVKMGPGTVIASSSSYNNAPYNVDQGIKMSPYELMPSWPTFNDYIFQPQIDLYNRPTYYDPWFKHAIDSYVPKPDFRNGWPYHSLDPFLNLW